MRLRTFTAHDMPAAMKLVREALGDDAVILSTTSNKGGKGVHVTAAVNLEDELPLSAPAPRAKATSSATTDNLRFELQNILRFHNLPELFIAKIMQKLPDAALTSTMALERLLGGFFRFEPLPLESAKLRLMLIGPPGSGKTLSVAKIAARLCLDKQPLTVITTDDKRAGGVEQLQAFTDILGLTLQVAANPKALQKILESLPARMRVLIDTAGYNPYDGESLFELQAFTALDDIEPVLVMPAGGDSLEAIDLVEPFAALPIKRLLVTRADTVRRLGGAMAAVAAHDLAFSNISRSPRPVDMLQAMDSRLLAQLLLRHTETYQLQTG